MEKTTSVKEAKITAEEIRQLDEISLDVEMSDKTLAVALQHHSNWNNELIKKRQTWWKEAAKKYNLDLDKHAYKVDATGTEVKIVKVNDKWRQN